MKDTIEIEHNTDYEMLETAFGKDYFIILQIKNKIFLTQQQKYNLQNLIDERNHLEILWFVNELRSISFGVGKQ